VFKGYRADLPQTPPPKSLTPNRKIKRGKNRSTRLPDFAQLVFQIKAETPGFILDNPPKYGTRLLLIVEIQTGRVWNRPISKPVLLFATYPEVNAFGVIIALGHLLDLERVLSGEFEVICHSI